MKSFRNLVFGSLLCFLTLSFVQPYPAAGEKSASEQEIPMNPEAITGTLGNGLKYYILKNEKPEDRVELRLVVNIGSLAEDEDQQGLAHFVEHMAFNGTKNFAKNELIDYLESAGVKFGPHLNAYTSFDETVYMLQLPTDDEEILNTGLQVLEDWAHNVSFDSVEVEKERGVVIEEWRQRLGGETRMMYEYLPVLYKDSRYPERLPIGKKEVLENFDHATLTRFYNDWYRPDLMAVVAVGDFNPEEMEAKIKEHFSRVPVKENPRKREFYPIPDHKEVLAKVTTDKEATFTTVRVNYKNDKHHYKTVTDYRRMLVQNLYNSMMSERLEDLKAQADPPFVFAWSAVSGMTRTKDAYVAGAYVNEDGVKRGLENLLRETERVEQHGFTKTELERNKKKLLRRMQKAYEERDKTESSHLVWGFVGHYLSNSPEPGVEWEYKMYQKMLPGITLEEVNGITEKWVNDENVVIVVTAPEKEGVEIPSEEKLVQLFREMNETELEPLKEEKLASTLMADIPEPAKIIAEKQLAEVEATEITLANGVKVVLKSTDFKNDEILFNAFSYGGSSLYDDAKYYSAEMAGPGVSESGVSEFTKTQLDKMLSDKVVSVSPYVSSLSEGLRGSASAKDLETMFQLIHLYFTDPRQDEVAFQSFLQRQMMIFQNLSSNPEYYFFNRVSEIMTQNHTRSSWLWDQEDFEKVDFEEAYKIYDERFANPADFTFFFVGSFEEDEIKPLLQRYLGSLEADPEKERWKDIGMRYVKGNVDEKVYRGVEPKSWVSLNFTGDYSYSAQNNFEFKSLIEVLRIKLREQLREEQGGVYGVSVAVRPSKFPVEDYQVEIGFSCDPEKADSLINIALAEVEKGRNGQIEDKDVTKVKEKARRELETNLKENRYWLNTLRNAYYYEIGPEEAMDKAEMIENLEKEDLVKVAQKYLGQDNFAKIVMYPENMAQTGTE